MLIGYQEEGERMKVMRVLAYFFGVIGGISLVMGVILRLSAGPGGALFNNVRANAFLEFSQVCLIFAAALGIAVIMESLRKAKK